MPWPTAIRSHLHSKWAEHLIPVIYSREFVIELIAFVFRNACPIADNRFHRNAPNEEFNIWMKCGLCLWCLTLRHIQIDSSSVRFAWCIRENDDAMHDEMMRSKAIECYLSIPFFSSSYLSFPVLGCKRTMTKSPSTESAISLRSFYPFSPDSRNFQQNFHSNFYFAFIFDRLINDSIEMHFHKFQFQICYFFHQKHFFWGAQF